MENMKYQYHVQTWGGFYNEEHQKIHGHKPGDFVFDTKKERNNYVHELRQIEEKLGARHLATTMTEGFNCNVRTTLHRISKFEDKVVHDTYDMGVNYPYGAASYHMEWKWYPGFNHYPFGEDFDYRKNKVEILQEWVTGAFDQKGED